jgi:lactoylglutathione lyase
MKFCWTTIYVKNLDESLNFYRNIIGLDLIRRKRVNPDMELAFLGAGETQIELIDDKKTECKEFSENFVLGFQTDSLEGTIEFLTKKNIPIHSGPFQPNPNLRFIYCLDPNGVKIQFNEFLK